MQQGKMKHNIFCIQTKRKLLFNILHPCMLLESSLAVVSDFTRNVYSVILTDVFFFFLIW